MTYALAKYANGFVPIGTEGDEEIFSSHADYTDLSSLNAVVVAEELQATDDETTVAITGTIVPAGSEDDVYTGTNIGDGNWVPDMDEVHNLERLRSITITEDDLGVAKRQVEWNSLAEEDSLRQQKQLSIWTPGSLSGRSDAVSPVSLGGPVSFGEMSSGSITSFSAGGFLVSEKDPTDANDPGHSQWQLMTEDQVAFAVVWTMTGSDPDDGVVIGVRRRGADMTTITEFTYAISANAIVPSQNTAADDFKTAQGFYTNELFLTGESAQIFVYSTGFYSAGLAVDLKATSLY